MWTGDIPAITKLMNLSGHNSYLGCRFCWLKGVYCYKAKHVYYPCQMPKDIESSDYDPKNLPLRTEKDFFDQIKKIEIETQTIMKKKYIKESGKKFKILLI